MTRKDRTRKLAQRLTHAERRDDRQPHGSVTADDRRRVFRDQRRLDRRARR